MFRQLNIYLDNDDKNHFKFNQIYLYTDNNRIIYG